MTLDEAAVYGNSTVTPEQAHRVEEQFFEIDIRSVVVSLFRQWKPKVTFSILALFTWIPPLLGTLLVISFLDFLSGVLASKAQGGEIVPDKARRGIALKFLLILLAVSGYIVQGALPQTVKTVIPEGANLGSFLCTWIILTEFLSIFRHVKNSGYMFRGPVDKVLMLAIPEGDKETKPTIKP